MMESNLNLTSSVVVAKTALPNLNLIKGSVVFVSSIVGKAGKPVHSSIRLVMV